ncbi:hypothetical protein PR048_021101 [Dryococelus australis]|uniref:Uncharacterized protein n=1 Tax=Dryococelus australis TaxID=614101 RepID=A0ABQ9GX96_9NEOP|nr:hypothetical protein PR048_021101 [Dryococelus australis]
MPTHPVDTSRPKRSLVALVLWNSITSQRVQCRNEAKCTNLQKLGEKLGLAAGVGLRQFHQYLRQYSTQATWENQWDSKIPVKVGVNEKCGGHDSYGPELCLRGNKSCTLEDLQCLLVFLEDGAGRASSHPLGKGGMNLKSEITPSFPQNITSPLLRNVAEFTTMQSRATVILDKADYDNKLAHLITTDTHMYLDKKYPLQHSMKGTPIVEKTIKVTSQKDPEQSSCHIAASHHIYGLPVIHKPDMPLQPTISNCNSPYKMGHSVKSVVHLEVWLRSVDDMFLVWQDGHETLEELANFLDSQMSSIKFTYETKVRQSTRQYRRDNACDCISKSIPLLPPLLNCEPIPDGQHVRLRNNQICPIRESIPCVRLRATVATGWLSKVADKPSDLVHSNTRPARRRRHVTGNSSAFSTRGKRRLLLSRRETAVVPLLVDERRSFYQQPSPRANERCALLPSLHCPSDHCERALTYWPGFIRSWIPALLHNHHASPVSVLKTSLRAVQTSPLTNRSCRPGLVSVNQSPPGPREGCRRGKHGAASAYAWQRGGWRWVTPTESDLAAGASYSAYGEDEEARGWRPPKPVPLIIRWLSFVGDEPEALEALISHARLASLWPLHIDISTILSPPRALVPSEIASPRWSLTAYVLLHGTPEGRIRIHLRANEREAERGWSSTGMRERGKREIPENTHRPAALSGTIPICENRGATPP